jgi:hypothetical protein
LARDVFAEKVCPLDIILEKRIKTEVRAKPGPIIGVA